MILMVNDVMKHDRAHDPGGKHSWPLLPGVRGPAEFSPCGPYRHILRRDWGDPNTVVPFMLSVGMNPSTAGAFVDDPTLRKDQTYAWREGFKSLVKVNICDFRATHPKQLLAPDILPRSDENLPAISRLAKHAGLIVVCWGVMHPQLQGYVQQVVKILKPYSLWCFGVNTDNSPRHPLFLPNDAPLMVWHP